ncbi:MAG TPA: TlpA family protein disulfide reductase, partial [Giesbergeria sp.]|nr:TlpA family protein disulfide reductase [Giesbergeria sp.]
MRRWALGLVCAAGLVLAGCSQSAAPASTFVLLDGTQQTTQDLRGKVVGVKSRST